MFAEQFFQDLVRITHIPPEKLALVFIILCVLVVAVVLYAAVRVEQIWKHIKHEQETARIREAVKEELAHKESITNSLIIV